MARLFYTIVIVFTFTLNSAVASMAMGSAGQAQTASSGPAMHPAMHPTESGGPQTGQYNPETNDADGSCGNFCLNCGCLICEVRNLSGAAAEITATAHGFPSPRLFARARRVDQDVAKPPPKP